MATITSLKDLIQKISNDPDRTFSGLDVNIETELHLIGSSKSLAHLFYNYGVISGILKSLFFCDYISSEERDSLGIELSSLIDNRSEVIILGIGNNSEEGE